MIHAQPFIIKEEVLLSLPKKNLEVAENGESSSPSSLHSFPRPSSSPSVLHPRQGFFQLPSSSPMNKDANLESRADQQPLQPLSLQIQPPADCPLSASPGKQDPIGLSVDHLTISVPISSRTKPSFGFKDRPPTLSASMITQVGLRRSPRSASADHPSKLHRALGAWLHRRSRSLVGRRQSATGSFCLLQPPEHLPQTPLASKHDLQICRPPSPMEAQAHRQLQAR